MIKKINFQNPHLLGRLVLVVFFLVGMGLAYYWGKAAGALEDWLWLKIAFIFPLVMAVGGWEIFLVIGLIAGAMFYYGRKLGKKELVISGYGLMGGVWLILLYISFHIPP